MTARAVTRELLVVLLFVVLTILNTWPLLPNLSTAVSDPGDPYLVTWILDWDWWATTHRPLSLFHAPIFHPSRYAFAFSEHLYGVALPLFPLYALGVPPITIYNIAVILGFALSGYGAFVLARTVTRSFLPSLCAGIFYAFVPFRFTHLPHLPHIWAASLPLLLASLIYYLRKPSWGRGALIGAAFLWNGLANVHWMMFGTIAFALSGIYLLFTRPDTRTRRVLLPVIASVAVAGLLLLPFVLPYRSMSKLYKIERGRGEATGGSARAIDWFITLGPNKTYGSLANVKYATPERLLFPGVLSILFTASALLLSRREDFPAADPSHLPRSASRVSRSAFDAARSTWDVGSVSLRILDAAIVICAVLAYYQWADEKDWPVNFRPTAIALLLIRLAIRFPDALGGRRGYSLSRIVATTATALRWDPDRRRFPVGVQLAILWVIVGVLGSRGVRMFFYEFLFENVYGFRSIRVPARMAMIAYVGIAVLVAAGVLALMRRMRPPRATAFGVVIALLFLVELRAAPIRWYLALPEPPPVYRWLASVPVTGAVAEFPFGNWEEAEYVLRQTVHHRPLVNGVSGHFPDFHRRLEAMSREDPVPDELLTILERIHCSVIVIHNDRWDATPQIRQWVQRGIAAKRLEFLNRFEHDVDADYVFGLTRVEKNLERLRAPALRDPAGFLPAENAERFLAGESRLYNAGTFANLDEPTMHSELRGKLRVSGWALSPHGIQAVNLRFENGRVVIPANLWAWEDISRLYPWYPRTTRPGFIKEFDSRPDGISADTDLQVEIVDGAGGRTRLENVHFRWHRKRGVDIANWNPAALDRLLARLGHDPAKHRDDVVHRRVSIEQLAYQWAEALGSRSDEQFVNAAFRTILDREPDATGQQFYLDRLRRGESRRDVIDAFLRSDEFVKQHAQ